MAQAKFRFRNKKKFKTKYELDDAVLMDEEFQKITDDMTMLEAQHDMVKALAEGYEAIRNAASREIFRRSSEQAPRD